MKVAVSEGRARLRDLHGDLEIEIPAKKNWFLICFLVFWLCFWGFGEVMVLVLLLEGGQGPVSLFLLVWLGMWTVGGGVAIYACLWSVMGKEVVHVSSAELSVKKTIGVFSRSKEYDMVHINDLRLRPGPVSLFSPHAGWEFWGLGGGTMQFDYGKKTVPFGIQLDEAEGKYIVGEIKKRFSGL